MKQKFISVLLLFLLSISITACSSFKSSSNLNNSSNQNNNKTSDTTVSSSSPVSNPIVSSNEKDLAMEAYKKVLENKVNFISSDDKKNISLNDFLNEKIPGYKLKVTHFAVLDMDGDKIPEVVLELSVGNYPDYFEVLHYNNSTVYGYNFVLRGLMQLKIDGTFSFSSGAADNGFGKLRFKENTCETDILAYSKSSQSNDAITISYFINNKSVTKEEFNSFVKEQNGKKDAVWHELSENNIETELSN